MKKRIFIAFDIPENIRQKLIISPLPFLRLTKIENLHVTLLFIGHVAGEKIAGIIKTLENTARDFAPLKLKITEIIPAPKGKFPRMIWADFEENPEFKRLANRLAAALAEFKPDNGNEPHIHVTLARFNRSTTPLEIAGLKFRETEPAGFTAETVCLYESKLTPEGPVYWKLSEIRLMGK